MRISHQHALKNRILLGRALLGLFLLLMGTSQAHQQKSAITRVLFNSNTGNMEVMHRFFIHDAEHAAGLIFGEAQDLIESSASRELFSHYVMNRFAVSSLTQSGEESALDLEYIGAEVDGQFLWVYQEISQPEDLAGLSIVNMALRDVWPDQVNLVNIEFNGQIYTLNFDDRVEELSVFL